MAEIKFREAIYAEPDNRFVGWHYWGWIDGQWEMPESNDPSASYQFTTRSDSHGVAIYAGDILARGGDNHNVVVVFGDAEGYPGFHTEESKLKGESGKRTHGLPPDTAPMTVIGNVVETPKLKSRWGRS